ncbi:MAG: adenylate/guanylate cyclase domain-containing protein [Acidimicrobiia bacterium]
MSEGDDLIVFAPEEGDEDLIVFAAGDGDGDMVVFAPEDTGDHTGGGGAWRVLVVDDEPEVHEVTRIALEGFRFEGRPLLLTGAFSAAEGAEALARHPDTAVVLLDVVMESDTAGLELARRVRQELANPLVRIILRTGQPGQAPERRVLVDYDINDYKDKADLTATRLFTAMVSALRSYRDLAHLDRLNRALARFVPPRLTELLGKPTLADLALGDCIQVHMAVLFADLRSFTAMSEGLSPLEAFRFVNDYLAALGPVIRTHGGYIDKYIGDAILAVFPGGADDALTAASAMQHRVDELNVARRAQDEPALSVGVGVHAGPLTLGIVGEEERLEGTVIADAVNLASRLEGLCKDFGVRIVTTEDCLAAAGARAGHATRLLGTVPIRGKLAAVRVYELFAGDPPERRDAKLATRSALRRAVEGVADGRFEEAIEELRTVLDAIPDDPVSRHLLAEAEGSVLTRRTTAAPPA